MKYRTSKILVNVITCTAVFMDIFIPGCHGDSESMIADTVQHNAVNQQPQTPEPGAEIQGMSLVLEKEAANANFIRLVSKPNVIGHGTTLQVEYLCQFEGHATLELHVWDSLHQDHVAFVHTWSCSPHVITPLRKHVRVTLADHYAYRPSVLNLRAQSVRKLIVKVYLLEDNVFEKTKSRRRYDAAQIKATYRTKMLEPLSRGERPVRGVCLTWWTKIQLMLPYTPTCPQESVEYKLLRFPVAFGEGKSGVHRAFTKHVDPVLEKRRLEERAHVKFTLVMWLYVDEWCRGPRLCSIFHHLTWDEYYRTPVVLINSQGKLHIQIATTNDRPLAFLTNDFSVPRRQWFRLVIRCNIQKFEVDALFGDSLEKKFSTWYRFGVMDPVYFDQTVGVFSIGGSEMNKAFKGVIGEVSFYRDYVNLNELKMPGPYHVMYELPLNQRRHRCASFSNWVRYRTFQCQQMLRRKHLKNTCSYSFEDIFHAKLNRVQFPIPQCWRDEGPNYAHYRHVNRLIKQWVYQRVSFAEIDVGKQLYEDSKRLIEEKGLDKVWSIVPLLRQASCHGYHDASFMLGAIFSKGIVVRVDEIQALSYLMEGAMANHRLCLLSLGNKHTHGLDGASHDLEIAYAYYKNVGDMTKGDRDKHSENDVVTEHVRLTDDVTLNEQTEEGGDLFLWFKHQAQQGEVHAMQNMGRLLFWGAQGVHRDLRAAAEYYRMGALNGDAQSMHDYGITLLKGQGVEQNETVAKHWLEKAAELGHVNAHNALGWFALERDFNYSLALHYFNYSHERGNPDAAYNIGHMLQYGRLENKTVDKVNAYPYFFAGAARGQIDAALMVAQTHQRGHPLVDRNPFTSLDWARFVSELNPAVGTILHRGLKAYQAENWPAALLYYIMAAESGVEVGNFNLAYLCEQNVEGVVTQLQKECVYTHYNLSTKRYPHQVDPYAWIKMGDYYYYGLGGERDVAKAANAFCEAALRWDPHAMYNLGYMVEDGAEVPTSVWYRLNIAPHVYHNNASLLAELYFRCSESYKNEAYIPCILSLYRVQLTDIWTRYHLLLKFVTVLSVVLATLFTIPSLRHHLHTNRAVLTESTQV